MNATGGGSSGGALPAGLYNAGYTYIDSVSGLESALGISTSAPFATAAGDIPQITFNDSASKPGYAASRNVYLQPLAVLCPMIHRADVVIGGGASSCTGGTWRTLPTSGGIPQTPTPRIVRRPRGYAGYQPAASFGTFTLYAAGVAMTQTTYNLATAPSGTNTPPPNTNLMPSFVWAAASVVSTKSNSIASTSNTPGNPYAANPWTLSQYLDYLRHWIKYQLYGGGPDGLLAQHAAAINNYSGTPLPYLVCYESSMETLVPFYIDPTAPNGPDLVAQLTHDVFYHPDQYYAELAYFQTLQQGGLRTCNQLYLVGGLAYLGGDTSPLVINTWEESMWSGQAAGHGDNSDGLGTNQFWMNTGKCENLTNVSPRYRAFLDWAAAANCPAGPFRPLTTMAIARTTGARTARPGRVNYASMPLGSVSASVASPRIIRSHVRRDQRGRLSLPSRTTTPQMALFRASPIVRSTASRGRHGVVLLPSRTPTPQIHLIAGPMMVRTTCSTSSLGADIRDDQGDSHSRFSAQHAKAVVPGDVAHQEALLTTEPCATATSATRFMTLC